jgi:hypothetical protein
MNKSSLLLALSLTATSAFAAGSDFIRCTTEEPSKATLAKMVAQAKSSPRAVTAPQFIDIVWHDIQKSDGTGALSDQFLLVQIAKLNQAFHTNGMRDITFRVARSPGPVVNDEWFASCKDNEEMRNTLSYQPEKYINVFSCDDPNGGLGYAYQPYAPDFTEQNKKNLVYVNYRTVPGGGYPEYDEGATLAHEIGHYLGLMHVFYPNVDDPNANVCLAGGNPYTGGSSGFEGDFVADTPAQRVATEGCPAKVPSSCPGSVDSIHNYMDYSFDRCLADFTHGQRDFMYYMSAGLRPTLWNGGGVALQSVDLIPVRAD